MNLLVPPGRLVGDSYRVERKIGSGAMADVYVARDIRHKREVALKVLKPELASALAAGRFLREIEIAARLSHPHILPVHDSGEFDGLPYYVMPLVGGETLRQRLDRERQLPLDDAIRIAGEVAEALAHAHARGVVHRDIKPENILLEDGHARVADFGVASAVTVAAGERITSTGIAVGTPLYMSPEQAAGERDVDARSDIYALGCVLYEMLGGEPPFIGASSQAILAKKVTQEVPPLRVLRDSVPPALERVIQKALKRSPADRFASAADFAGALRSYARWTDESEVARGLALPVRRKTLIAAVVSVVVLGIALAAALWPRAGAGSAAPDIRAIALLPVVADSQQASLADEIQARIIDELSHIKVLRVTGARSSMQYRGTRKLAPEIARELDVDALVESSARAVGDSLHVHVRLIGSSAGEQLWAREFTSDARHLDRLQKQVTREIASYLQLPLTPEERGRLGRFRVINPAANEAYQRGLRLGASFDPDRFRKSIAAFEEAIRVDPEDPRPHVALGDLYSTMGLGHDTIPPAEAFRRAKESVERALRLDPQHAEAHAAMGGILQLWDWDWAGAEREYKLAIQSNPGSAAAHAAYGVYLRSLGQADSSVAEHHRARKIDPFSTINLADLTVAYTWAGRPDSAIKWGREALDLEPNFAPGLWALGAAFMEKGQHDSSIMYHRRAVDVNPQFRWHLAEAYAAAGRTEEFDRLIASRTERDRRGSIPLARAYAKRGDQEAMFRSLELAVENHHPWISLIRGDPEYRRFAAHPRYQALLRRLGLPQW